MFIPANTSIFWSFLLMSGHACVMKNVLTIF
jgi:hypothetical protein